MGSGKVYLVGSGPGDPRLLTLRAVECINKAQVVVYDRLVPPRIENLASREARRLYVGKSSREHTVPQEEISRKLVELAREGYRVVRLKGGDPFVFGRGGEEAEELAAAGIPFEIVPGVTSALSVPAYAGIPVTHRDYASSFTVVTGHEAAERDEPRLRYSRFAGGADTLIFLMGVENLETITRELQEGGCPGDRPAAVIRWGTRAEQVTVTGTLRDISARVRERGIAPPAVLLVGEVVRLRERINWRENAPLFGRRVVVTRAAEQASRLSAMIEELGGEAWEFPVIRIIPPSSWEPLDRALDRLGEYAWMIFTSANGVEYFFRRLEERERDIRELAGLKLAAIGPRTREALKERGLKVDFMPEEFRAERVAEGMLPLIGEGERILLPRAAEAREILPQTLREAGVPVDEVPAYQTVTGEGEAERLRELLQGNGVDAVTFTSSSTVRNFLDKLGPGAAELLRGVTLASIGPITSATLQERGFTPGVEAREYTLPGLIDALLSGGRFSV